MIQWWDILLAVYVRTSQKGQFISWHTCMITCITKYTHSQALTSSLNNKCDLSQNLLINFQYFCYLCTFWKLYRCTLLQACKQALVWKHTSNCTTFHHTIPALLACFVHDKIYWLSLSLVWMPFEWSKCMQLTLVKRQIRGSTVLLLLVK